MMAPLVLRQLRTLLRIAVTHVADDPVVFGMQVARRLPVRFSRMAALIASVVPGAAAQASSAWLRGDVDEARQYIRARPASARQARLLGELALSLGDRETAARIAEERPTVGSQRLAARVYWYDGAMSAAVAAAPESTMRDRLASELRVFQPGWTPSVSAPNAASVPGSLPHTDVLFGLTNSLPHTQSGYTLRTHALLEAVGESGVRVLAANRTGYPTSVGKLLIRDRARVGEVDYLYDVPARVARTLQLRLDQQATFLRRVGERSRAQLLHTTTHFTNGLVTRTAAESLGIPWVYEVRGSLENTWASSRGEAEARRSERFALFRSREVDVASSADAVITLGYTMADELVSRGVDRSKILVAPNSVGRDVLAADWRRDPADIRDELGLARDGVWVGTAASIVGYEGLDVLVDAVAAVCSTGVDLRLLIVGDGADLPALRLRARPLGGAAVFTGRVPSSDARRFIQALDIFAVPRKDVSVSRMVTPLKPVEAGGLGRAVVVSDLPALTEALPADARRTVKAGSVEALASELESLAADPDERCRLGVAARDYVEENRTWSALGRTYTTLYKDLGVSMKPVAHVE